MCRATWLERPVPAAGRVEVPLGGGVTSLGSTAFFSVSPSRVLPTAKAGPPPSSLVDSRLRPTTRTGGALGGGCGVDGGGSTLATTFGRTGFSTGAGGSGGG